MRKFACIHTVSPQQYFRYSFIRYTKISVENKTSCYYPIMHLLKYDPGSLSFLVQLYNMALLGVIFPTYFSLIFVLINELLKYNRNGMRLCYNTMFPHNLQLCCKRLILKFRFGPVCYDVIITQYIVTPVKD